VPKLLSLAAALFVTLAFACGSDRTRDNPAEPTEAVDSALEEYFDDLENVGYAVLDDVDPDCLDLDPTFGLDFDGSTEELRDEYIRFNACLAGIGQLHITYLEGLDPPQVAAAAHERWVAAQRSFWADYEEQARELHAATSEEEIFAAFAGSVHEDVWAEEDAACRELQRIADDHDIRADLECNEE
jgi:hypothetical protein